MSECRAILNDRAITNYTEITQLDFSNYNILGRFGDKLLQPKECAVLILKPERVSLKHHVWDEFMENTKGRCVAYECRLGCMERSIVLGFQDAADAILFKLRNA